MQIEFARRAWDPNDSRTEYMLYSRSRELQDLYGSVWAAEFAGLTESYGFERGFISLIRICARGFLDRGEFLFARAPIRHLDLTRVRDVDEELFLSRYIGRLHSLAMDGCGLYDIHLQMLAASPQVGPLRWLSVADNHTGMPGPEAMAASRNFESLRFAEFRGNPIDPGEQLGIDSGIVVTSWMPPEGLELESRHGYLPWLHRDGETDRLRV